MKKPMNKKGLPKAQVGLNKMPPVLQLNGPNPANSLAWTSPYSAPPAFPVSTTPMYRVDQNQGTPVANPTPALPLMSYNNQFMSQADANTMGAGMVKNLKPFSSRKDLKGFIKNYNQSFGTKYKLPFMTRDRVKLANDVSDIGNAALLTGSAIEYFNQDRKGREWERFYKQNMYDQSVSGEDEGNYTTNTGVFQPNMLPSPNEGMFMNGGNVLNDTNMTRIRIIAGPKQMAYGGQTNYGLDITQGRSYADMPEGRSERVSNTLTAVPRQMANIEAEGGETLYGDVDGDGANEFMHIKGERHYNNGVPLNAPDGSFIFSDTKKMKIKDPQVLATFGKKYKKGGYTPAEISKQYDINKYKAIMEDPNADELSKSTAQMMVKNYQNKLGALSFTQEQMKGFPQGIPQAAQGMMDEAAYGGYLPTAQFGGPNFMFAQGSAAPVVTPAAAAVGSKPTVKAGPRPTTVKNFKEAKDIADYYRQFGYTGKADIDQLQKWMVQKAKTEPEFADELDNYLRTVDLTNKGRKLYGKDADKSKLSIDQLYTQFNDGLWDYRFPKLSPKKKETTVPNKFMCTANGVVEMPGTAASQYQVGVYNTYAEALAACEKKTETEEQREVIPNKNTFTGNDVTPFGYMTPDVVNMMAAAAIPPSVTFGFRPKNQFEPGKYVLEDWLSKAQQRQQAFNIASQTAATYGPASGLATNLSFMAGQTGDGVTGDVSAVDSRNVDRANIALATERQRKDQNNLFNLAQSQELWKENAIAKQQLENAQRKYWNDNADAFGRAWDNRMNLGLVNVTNPMYNIDNRSGRSYFKKGYDASRLGMMGSTSPTSDEYWASLNDGFQKAKLQFPDLTVGQYLNRLGVTTSSNDRDNDGIPDKVTKRSTAAFGGYIPFSF